jgi:peptidoglycan/LPS O-acetylase OafA/YrhL
MTAQRTAFHATTASALLDLIRGLAAIAVCLGHWRNVFFVDYPQIKSHRLAFAIPYVMTSGGHQAVVIFFVLSGFLVGGSVVRAVKKGTWSWKQYLTHRLVRLWLVLIPALTLAAVLDRTGIHLHHAPALYSGLAHDNVVNNVTAGLSATTFAGNVVFLQGIFVQTFGSDGPLWSLANEFWYYILFPCGLLLCFPSTSRFGRIVSLAVFLGIGLMIGKGILLGFPIWLAGALLAVLPVPRVSFRWKIGIVLAYVPLFFFLAKTHAIGATLSDYLLGASTFLLLWCFLSAQSAAGEGSWVKFARGTARFSYTLYLVHLPFLVLVASLTVKNLRWQPTPEHISWAFGILAAAIVYAWCVALATEFQTDRVRGWVESGVIGFGGRNRTPASK